MEKCPWCNCETIVRKSPMGYFVECKKNGHVHNIGVFPGAIRFGKTENEAEDEWNFRVKEFVSQNKLTILAEE